MALESETDDIQFTSSKLGTKQFWDETFMQELAAYKEMKDVGEVWFGNASIKRVADWMEKSDLVSPSSSILDIGCGNGMMLVKLAKNGYKSLFGIDYCCSAVELAKEISKDEGVFITYMVCSILDGSVCKDLNILNAGDNATVESVGATCNGYDVVLDKGTYDAVSLNPDNARHQRSLYLHNLCELLHSGGLFIITSCNWTEEELIKEFESDFSLHAVIPSTQFTFGGILGKKETVLALRKR